MCILDRHQDPRANQDLPGLGFVAKPRSDIGYRSDGGIVEASLKADSAERGKSVRNRQCRNQCRAPADATSQSTLRWPLRISSRHQHGLKGGVIYWNWVVEHHHHPVTSIAFKRAAILVYDLTNRRVVFTQ